MYMQIVTTAKIMSVQIGTIMQMQCTQGMSSRKVVQFSYYQVCVGTLQSKLFLQEKISISILINVHYCLCRLLLPLPPFLEPSVGLGESSALALMS